MRQKEGLGMDKPLLSIIIVKYHCDDYLEQCLSSIGQNSYWEVIIVDNEKENIGYGAGCNKGAKLSKGKYLFFLNPDTIILNGSLEKMIDFLEKNQEVAVLGPKIYKNTEKERQLSFCRFPGPFTSLFVFSPLKSLWPDNPVFSHYVYNENKKENGLLAVEAVAGAAILVRKDFFDKVSGFDENFFLYFEENDLCKRIRKQKGKIVYFPEAEIIHFGGKSTVDLENADKHFRASRFYFFQKFYGKGTAFVVNKAISFLERLTSLQRLRKEKNGIFEKHN